MKQIAVALFALSLVSFILALVLWRNMLVSRVAPVALPPNGQVMARKLTVPANGLYKLYIEADRSTVPISFIEEFGHPDQANVPCSIELWLSNQDQPIIKTNVTRLRPSRLAPDYIGFLIASADLHKAVLYNVRLRALVLPAEIAGAAPALSLRLSQSQQEAIQLRMVLYIAGLVVAGIVMAVSGVFAVRISKKNNPRCPAQAV